MKNILRKHPCPHCYGIGYHGDYGTNTCEVCFGRGSLATKKCRRIKKRIKLMNKRNPPF